MRLTLPVSVACRLGTRTPSTVTVQPVTLGIVEKFRADCSAGDQRTGGTDRGVILRKVVSLGSPGSY